MVDWADVSAWQATVDLDAYKAAGYGLISLRTSDGTYKDPTFATRWEKAGQIGLRRMAYHFARPGDPQAQAQILLSQIHDAGGWRPGDFAMADTEWFSAASLERLTLNPEKPISGHWRAGDPENGVTSNAVNASLTVKGMTVLRDRRALAWVGLNPADALGFCRTFFAAVQADNPDAFLIDYGNEWYIAQAGITPTSLPGVGVIVAAYGPSYQTPPGWSHACGWQFTDSAQVAGISGGCDANHVTCTSDPAFAHLDPGDDMSAQDVADIKEHIDQATLIGAALLSGQKQDPKTGHITHTLEFLKQQTDNQEKVIDGIVTEQKAQGALLAKIAAKLDVQ